MLYNNTVQYIDLKSRLYLEFILTEAFAILTMLRSNEHDFV